jgi:hypothetical protein
MQQIIMKTLGRNGRQGSAGFSKSWRGLRGCHVRRSLLCLGLSASLLSLTGCEGMGFPWDKKPQLVVEQASTVGGPSVTRGRPSNGQPAIKAKIKPKAKKPASPPATNQQPATAGPAIAADPGQPAVTGDEGAASDSAATTRGPNNSPNETSGNDQLTNLPADQGSATADQPSGQSGHSAGNRPSDMIGRDESGIRSLIGEPTKTRTQGSTTVWSYQKDGCSLDLFLFYDVKTGAQRVLSYEIKPDVSDTNAIQACYDKFHNV